MALWLSSIHSASLAEAFTSWCLVELSPTLSTCQTRCAPFTDAADTDNRSAAWIRCRYVESSTFCAYEYPAFDCTCPLGTPEPCPAVTCVNATAAGNCNAEASDAIATRGLDLNTLPMERCTIANFTGVWVLRCMTDFDCESLC